MLTRLPIRIASAALALAAPQLSLGAVLPDPAAATPASVAMEEAVEQWAAEHAFNGVVTVGRGGHAVEVYVFGVADPDTGRKLTRATVFQTGSIDKYFVSIAAFALAGRGLIDLDAPISTYLPSYRTDTGSKVTLANILSNGSGVPNQISLDLPAMLRENPGATLDSLGYTQLSLAEGVSRYASGDLAFAPGTQFDYSNSNWAIAKLVLESATGKSIAPVLRDEVFDPAGMDDSGSYVGDLTAANARTDDVAVGHNATGRHDGDYPLLRFSGGGTYTSEADLIALEHRLHGGGLLGDEMHARFVRVIFPKDLYAHGGRFQREVIAGAERHLSIQSGSNGATKVTVTHDLDADITIVAMGNLAPSHRDMFEISETLLEQLYAS